MVALLFVSSAEGEEDVEGEVGEVGVVGDVGEGGEVERGGVVVVGVVVVTVEGRDSIKWMLFLIGTSSIGSILLREIEKDLL